MKTFYLDCLPEGNDLSSVEGAVNSEGFNIELSEVIFSKPCINVHGYTPEVYESLKYYLNMAGCIVLEVA